MPHRPDVQLPDQHVAPPRWRRATLGEAETYLEPHRLQVKAVLESGSPVEGILQVAQRESCDLIIMGAFGHSRMRELFVGSTTDGILRAAEIPVLLFR